MLWRELVVLFPLVATAAIWPPSFQEFGRQGQPRPVVATDSLGAFEEFGFLEGEAADFSDAKQTFTVTAWKFKDATGAIAAWHALRPSESTPSKALAYAANFPRGSISTLGNYVLQFDGYRPNAAELKLIFGDLPGFAQGSVPVLPSYASSRISFTSVRYIIGPKSFQSFARGWPLGPIAFDQGIELIVGEATSLLVAVVRYPTPHLARQKLAEVEADGKKRAQVALKRSGPLLIAVYAADGAPVNFAAAKPILDSVNFQADVIANEANPFRPVKEAANMLLSIFTLTGGLLAACLTGGLIFGALRMLGRRGEGGEAIQTLRLGK